MKTNENTYLLTNMRNWDHEVTEAELYLLMSTIKHFFKTQKDIDVTLANELFAINWKIVDLIQTTHKHFPE